MVRVHRRQQASGVGPGRAGLGLPSRGAAAVLLPLLSLVVACAPPRPGVEVHDPRPAVPEPPSPAERCRAYGVEPGTPEMDECLQSEERDRGLRPQPFRWPSPGA